jgi:hypothetical protein
MGQDAASLDEVFLGRHISIYDVLIIEATTNVQLRILWLCRLAMQA